jgi:hypothetical protein
MHRWLPVAWTMFLLAGCATLGHADPEDEVRRQFARDNFCPLSRVTVKPTVEMVGSPPPDVASDPDRLAMWQRAMLEQVNHEGDRQLFSASGCGDLANYACWDYQQDEQRGGLVVCTSAPAASPTPSNAVTYPRPADSVR